MRYVIGNWKMAPAIWTEAKKLTSQLMERVPTNADNVSVIVCPPLVYLRSVLKEIESGANFVLGAQNVHFEAEGPYTGEVSADQLVDSGASHVIVGHSERRALGEDNNIVAKKVRAAMSQGMTVILCVGESSRDGNWQDFLIEEVGSALSSLTVTDIDHLVIAYEPIWAIGCSEPDTPDGARSSAELIRKVISDKFGEESAKNTAVLYGGSVDIDNVIPFANQNGIDGVLVGRASRDADQFSRIVEAFL